VFEFAVKIVLESEGQPDVVFLQNAIASSNENLTTGFCINERRVLGDHVFGYFLLSLIQVLRILLTLPFRCLISDSKPFI